MGTERALNATGAGISAYIAVFLVDVPTEATSLEA